MGAGCGPHTYRAARAAPAPAAPAARPIAGAAPAAEEMEEALSLHGSTEHLKRKQSLKSAGHPQETLMCPTFTQTVFPEFSKFLPENTSLLMPEGALAKALATSDLERRSLKPGEHAAHLHPAVAVPALLCSPAQPWTTHQEQAPHSSSPGLTAWCGNGTANHPCLLWEHTTWKSLQPPSATGLPTPSKVPFPLLQVSSWGKTNHCRAD